jgi:hypothetical protein
MPNLLFLPWIIFYVFGLYLVLIVITIALYNIGYCKPADEITDIECGEVYDGRDSRNLVIIRSGFSFFSEHRFERTYLTIFRSRAGCIILLITRLLTFLYFAVVPLAMIYVRDNGRNAIYFSTWHVCFITLYFLLATICSLVGVCFECTRTVNDYTNIWPEWLRAFGSMVQVLYAVAGGTAFFVTTFVYAGGERTFDVWDVSQHLLISLVFVPELLLNLMEVRPEHLVINEGWILSYLCFIWPMVATGNIPTWPYAPLDVSTRYAFAWYVGLGALSCGLFLFWAALNAIKFSIVWYIQEPPLSDPYYQSQNSRQQGMSMEATNRDISVRRQTILTASAPQDQTKTNPLY